MYLCVISPFKDCFTCKLCNNKIIILKKMQNYLRSNTE